METEMTIAYARRIDNGPETKEEKEQAKKDMQEMLDYIDQLNKLDTSKSQPMPYLFSMGNVFREDEAENKDCRDAMLKNAPREKEGQFQVPKTIE